MKRFFKLFLVIFLGLFLASCDFILDFLPSSGSSSSSSSSSSSIDENYTISLNVENLELEVDDTYNFEVKYSNNQTPSNLTWDSANPEVATINNDGLLTAIKEGKTIVTVIAENDSSATCIVTVKAKTFLVESIILYDTNLVLEPNKYYTLIAKISPENATNKSLTWESSNEKVATVDQNGKVTTIDSGETIITVSSNDGSNKQAQCTIKVYQHVKEVILDKESLTLNVGETSSLVATISPSNATNKNVTWSSNNPSVVTVDDNGNIKAISSGSARIMVITEDGYQTDSCKIIAIQPVTDVNLNKDEATLNVGEIDNLMATILPNDATNRELVWTSSDETVATVENGTVVAVARGEATITVTTKDGNKTDTCKIIVNQQVYNVILDSNAFSLNVNESKKISATINPDNANDKTLSWTSSDERIATVDENGNVTAIAKGEVTITAKANGGSNVEATCLVTVLQPVTGVSFAQESGLVIINQTKQLAAIIEPANASNTTVEWFSENEEIATVDENGLITGVAVGSTTITVTTYDGNKSATYSISVVAEAIPTESVTITSKNNKTEIAVDENLQLTASVLPENTTDSLIWSSSDETIATVNNAGLVTAKNAGDVIITTTSGSKSSTYQIKVIIPVKGVKLNDSELLKKLTESVQLVATIEPNNATNKTVTWTSSNEEIATVDQNGFVTPIKAGTVIITVETVDGKYKASCKITFKNIIESIEIEGIENDIYVGDLVELKVNINPEDALYDNIVWSIETTDKASLEENVLTALKPGIVTVKVSVDGLEKTLELVINSNIKITFDNEESTTLSVGETLQINAQVTPASASNLPINWSSSNEVVATVSDGLVTTLRHGKTTITATVFDNDVEISKSTEIIVTSSDFLNVDFDLDGNENYVTNNLNYIEDGYYKFDAVGDKLTTPKFTSNTKEVAIEILYKATKSGNNDEDFNFKVTALNNSTSLTEINLNSTNTEFTSGDNISTFKTQLPMWESNLFIDSLTLELTKKKTGSNFWLYGIRLYYQEYTIVSHDNVSFHFLELGNKYTGDSIYIKAGDVDILIDAGSQRDSASTISSYIDDYVKDGKLEYVIATHAHEDHIAGFVGSSTIKGIFDLYSVDTIIDYALKNTTSQVSKDYESARDRLVAKGTKHYTAADCINGTNGGKDIFEITNGVTMTILNQIHYFEKSSDENDHSVCTLFTVGESNFLFTGDLEAGGEKSLVEKNDLPHCVLYKAGHHGSKTSSNNELLAAITPEIVTVCCCAGSSEYTKITDNMFPTQDFINRIAPYTTKVYVTTLATYTIETSSGTQYLKYDGFTSMNGNIVVTVSNETTTVNCSNNNTKLKDSTWFNTTITLNGETRKMRTWPNVESMYN